MKARFLISAILLVFTACGTARVDGVRIRPGTGNPAFFSEGILKAGEKVRTDLEFN